jgi:hypothetical protein
MSKYLVPPVYVPALLAALILAYALLRAPV